MKIEKLLNWLDFLAISIIIIIILLRGKAREEVCWLFYCFSSFSVCVCVLWSSRKLSLFN